MSAETETIDALLERYLALLDTYTQLRASLNALQSAMYQHLARANFSADRGIRYYGQDYYDERMQASRRISIGGGSEATTSPVLFTVKAPEPVTEARTTNDGRGKDAEGKEATLEKERDPKEETERDPKEETEKDSSSSSPPSQPAATKTTDEKKKPKSTDPLRWFGILTPLPLRQAQSSAISAVEDIIPRLASVSAEMASVELEVRRARKRRAKAEKEEEKKKVAELEKQIGGLEVNKNEEKQVIGLTS